MRECGGSAPGCGQPKLQGRLATGDEQGGDTTASLPCAPRLAPGSDGSASGSCAQLLLLRHLACTTRWRRGWVFLAAWRACMPWCPLVPARIGLLVLRRRDGEEAVGLERG